jgi:hypothetical protein
LKVFCVGLFRTGTTTIFEMFQKSFRADHEFQVENELDLVARRMRGEVSDTQLRAFVRERDAAKPLELDSCGVHFGLVDILVSEFPQAKFLLTLRDIYGWMNSCVGKLYGDFIGGWGSRAGMLVNCMEYLPDGTFWLEDRSKQKICLEQLMKAWSAVTRHTIHVIPRERLLIVDTDTLGESEGAIASFCEIAGDLLEPCHANPGVAANFLSCFDPDRLEALVRKHCSGLMSERYPGMTLASHGSRVWTVEAPSADEMNRYFTLDTFSLLDAEFWRWEPLEREDSNPATAGI